MNGEEHGIAVSKFLMDDRPVTKINEVQDKSSCFKPAVVCHCVLWSQAYRHGTGYEFFIHNNAFAYRA